MSRYEDYREKVLQDPYVKAEYADGQLAPGTDKPGYLYGMSLLLLGYESRVRITNNGHAIYDVDRGGRRAGPPAGWAGQLAGLHREEPR